MLGVIGVQLAATPASAADCVVMTLEPTANGLTLAPQEVKVPAGGCVQFSNQTLLTARFTVGSYRADVPAFSQTSAPHNYPATAAGTKQKVLAQETGGSATGAIVIAAKPAPSTSPTHPPSPAPRQPAPRPTTKPVSSPTPKPGASTSATPPAPLSVTPTAAPPASSSAVALPPSTQTPFLAGQPTPAASASAPAVVAGPLQPPTGRGAGLPAAVAALLVVGMGGALLRVLLAEPVNAVDNRRSVGAAL